MGRVRRSGPPAIGLDVGRHSIRLARLSRAGVTPSLGRLGQTVTPAGLFDSAGWLQSPDALAECLRQLAAEVGLSGCPTVVGLGGPLVIARPVELPEDGTVESALAAADDDLPLPAGEYRVTLHPFADGTRGLLVAAPQRLLDDLVGAIERAGLDPVVVDLTGFGAVYVLAGQLADGLPRVLGDWGAGGVTWSWLVGGRGAGDGVCPGRAARRRPPRYGWPWPRTCRPPIG